MAKKENGPIVYVEDFVESRGMRSLIESQANLQTGTIDDAKVKGRNNPKVKKLDYKRINQPKK